MTKTLGEYIDERNALVHVHAVESLTLSESEKQKFFDNNLGVANRHISRVLNGQILLTDGVCHEIEKCLSDAWSWCADVANKNLFRRTSAQPVSASLCSEKQALKYKVQEIVSAMRMSAYNAGIQNIEVENVDARVKELFEMIDKLVLLVPK